MIENALEYSTNASEVENSNQYILGFFLVLL